MRGEGGRVFIPPSFAKINETLPTENKEVGEGFLVSSGMLFHFIFFFAGLVLFVTVLFYSTAAFPRHGARKGKSRSFMRLPAKVTTKKRRAPISRVKYSRSHMKARGGDNITSMCVCVVIPFILDVCGRTSRGHTGGRSNRVSHPPSSCGAYCLNFFSREGFSSLFPSSTAKSNFAYPRNAFFL